MDAARRSCNCLSPAVLDMGWGCSTLSLLYIVQGIGSRSRVRKTGTCLPVKRFHVGAGKHFIRLDMCLLKLVGIVVGHIVKECIRLLSAGRHAAASILRSCELSRSLAIQILHLCPFLVASGVVWLSCCFTHELCCLSALYARVSGMCLVAEWGSLTVAQQQSVRCCWVSGQCAPASSASEGGRTVIN